MKRIKLFGMAGVLSLTVGGCFIYFPVFADGPVDISIIELVDDGSGGYRPWQDIVGAMPGETYSAIPRVLNNGEETVTVRMCLSESATDSAGGVIDLPPNTFGISINQHWVIDNDELSNVSDPASGNCYKYDSDLNPGVLTEPIFTEVSLNPALGNQYQGSTFNLHLVAEASSGDTPEPTPQPVPDNPNTGDNTAIRNFIVNTGLMFMTAGGLALAIMGIRKFLKK